jgi:acetyltransferase-like isoleucine patch superfamily enzyme
MNLFAPVLFHRYPGYIRWIWQRYVYPARVRRLGVDLEGQVCFSKCPIIFKASESIISIGAGSTLCSDSKATALGVNHPVILRTMRPGAKLHIGREMRMSGATICAAVEVIIGDRVVIGANVVIVDTDFHAMDPVVRSSNMDEIEAAAAPVCIEADVFIGSGVFVLKGVCIGRGAYIGAGSVVTRDVPAMAVAAGNPARVVGQVPGNTSRNSNK